MVAVLCSGDGTEPLRCSWWASLALLPDSRAGRKAALRVVCEEVCCGYRRLQPRTRQCKVSPDIARPRQSGARPRPGQPHRPKQGCHPPHGHRHLHLAPPTLEKATKQGSLNNVLVAWFPWSNENKFVQKSIDSILSHRKRKLTGASVPV